MMIPSAAPRSRPTSRDEHGYHRRDVDDPSAWVMTHIRETSGTSRPRRDLRSPDLRPTQGRPDARTRRAHPWDRSSCLAPAGLRRRRVVEHADRRKVNVGPPFLLSLRARIAALEAQNFGRTLTIRVADLGGRSRKPVSSVAGRWVQPYVGTASGVHRARRSELLQWCGRD